MMVDFNFFDFFKAFPSYANYEGTVYACMRQLKNGLFNWFQFMHTYHVGLDLGRYRKPASQLI